MMVDITVRSPRDFKEIMEFLGNNQYPINSTDKTKLVIVVETGLEIEQLLYINVDLEGPYSVKQHKDKVVYIPDMEEGSLNCRA